MQIVVETGDKQYPWGVEVDGVVIAVCPTRFWAERIVSWFGSAVTLASK